jgi:large subunit ribosomal protein L10
MPSTKILEAKQQAVKDLAEKLRNAQAGVLVNYQGISVEADTALRREFRAAGVSYMVMKNTLTGRACDEVGLGDMKQYLEGMTAIAICGEDPLAPAKIVKKYADKLESFQVKAGFIDGAVIDAAKVDELANIPAKEVLIARMLGSLIGPIQSLAFALQSVVDKNGESAEAAPAEA